MIQISDQNLTVIGQILVQLDEDNFSRKRPPTIEDQYALDAHGRRRFHGAFTGGFSAGYFNSVDTRDGWQPHHFQSSRTKKAKNVCQRPEDFMDDEDTDEHGIGSIGIRASSEFANHTGKGTKRKRAHTGNKGPIPGSPVLRDLLEYVTDTVGVRLLKKMGWKPGQGVGPRITKTEKKKVLRKYMNRKIHGGFLPNTEIESAVSHQGTSTEDVEVDRGILFAPDDLELFRCRPKNNYSGIGYTGLNKMSMISGEINIVDSPVFQIQDKNKKLSIRGQAFGVGAFETDDADIYQCDDMSRYDFVLDPEETRNNQRFNRKICESQRCSCLEGFVSAENRFERKELFSPPSGSENFTPIHVIRRSRFSTAVNEAKTFNGSSVGNSAKNILIAHNRGQKLDGLNSPANIRDCIQADQNCESIFKQNCDVKELLLCNTNSQTSGSIVERHFLPVLPTTISQEWISRSSWMDKLITTRFVGSSIDPPNRLPTRYPAGHEELKITALSGETGDIGASVKQNLISIQNQVKPSINDITQQMRSKKSSRSPKNYEEDNLELVQSSSLKTPQKRENTELTTGAELIESIDILQYVKTGADGRDIISDFSRDNFEKNTAKIKVFGKMTRTLNIWQPVSAVCKRFNILEPEVGCAQLDTKKAKSSCPIEFRDFCNETNTSETKCWEAVGTIFIPDQSHEFDEQCDHNSKSVKNVTESFRASNMISSAFSAKPKLRRSSNTICSNAVGNNFATSLIEEQYSEHELRTEHDTTKAMIDDGTDEKSFEHSPSLIQRDCSVGAKHDLFREIFLSCSEPSESDNESTEGIHCGTIDSLLTGKLRNVQNTERNTSPARGIFAQLNLDESIRDVNPTQFGLQQPANMCDTKTSSKIDAEIHDIIECKVESLSGIYGPAIPTKLFNFNDQLNCDRSHHNIVASKMTVAPKSDTSGAPFTWVEKSKVRKSKKIKKKQKKKRKDRKHKHV